MMIMMMMMMMMMMMGTRFNELGRERQEIIILCFFAILVEGYEVKDNFYNLECN